MIRLWIPQLNHHEEWCKTGIVAEFKDEEDQDCNKFFCSCQTLECRLLPIDEVNMKKLGFRTVALWKGCMDCWLKIFNIPVK